MSVKLVNVAKHFFTVEL